MQRALNVARLGSQVLVFPADNQHGGVLVGDRSSYGLVLDVESSILEVLDEGDELVSVLFGVLGGPVGRRQRVRATGRGRAGINGAVVAAAKTMAITSFGRYGR